MRALTLAFALLGSCAAPDPELHHYFDRIDAQFAAPGVVEARLGQRVRLGDLGVRPIAVVEDSRCPIGAACVWAGRLRLRAAISGAGEVELILGEPHALAAGGTVTLAVAVPEPWADRPRGVPGGPARRFGFRRD